MLLKQTIFNSLPDDPHPIRAEELVTSANQREDEATQALITDNPEKT